MTLTKAQKILAKQLYKKGIYKQDILAGFNKAFTNKISKTDIDKALKNTRINYKDLSPSYRYKLKDLKDTAHTKEDFNKAKITNALNYTLGYMAYIKEFNNDREKKFMTKSTRRFYVIKNTPKKFKHREGTPR